jgi:hypothetical protein
MEAMRIVYKMLSENLKGKDDLGDLDVVEYSIKIDLRGIKCEGVGRIQLTQDRAQRQLL